MLFDKNTFIVPAASADTHVYLKNTDGVVIFVIDPLSIVSLFTVGKEIRIKTKSDLHILSFDTSVNAISALPMLRLALDYITAQNAPLTGGGAINYVAKFTPNGTTISNSILYDNGTGLGIGTITPLGLLHIKSTSGITFRTESSTGAIFNINDNNTITYTGYNVSITGTFKYVDGNQATGYILTSDLNGNAIWQAPALLNLQQVLTNGSSTGNLAIKSPDGLSVVTVEDGDVRLDYNGSNSAYVSVSDNQALMATNNGSIFVGEFNTGAEAAVVQVRKNKNLIQHPVKNFLKSLLNEVSQDATTPLGIVTLQQLQASTPVLTLQQVLTNGNSTGNVPIIQTDGNSTTQLNIYTGNCGIGYTNINQIIDSLLRMDTYSSTFSYRNNYISSYIILNSSGANLHSDVSIALTAPIITLSQDGVGALEAVTVQQLQATVSTLDLGQVLLNGRSTGGIPFSSPDHGSSFLIKNGEIHSTVGNGTANANFISNLFSNTLSYTDGIISAQINQNNLSNTFSHDVKNKLQAPINEVSQDASTPLGIVTLQQLQASTPALTLQQVLTNNPSTGGLGIKSPDASSFMYISNGDFYAQGGYSSAALIANNIAIDNPGILDLSQDNAQIASNNGSISVSESNSTSNRIQLYIAQTVIRHSIKNYFDSPLNEVSQDATTALGIVTLQQLQSNLAAAPKKYTETASSFIANVIKTITHNIGNTAISITLWDSTTGDMILGFDANNRTLNSVDIDISVTGNYDIVIIG